MPGQQNDNSQQHPEALYLLVIAMFVFAGWFLWHFVKPIPVYFMLTLSYVEMKVMSLVGLGDSVAAQRIQGYFTGRYDPWDMPIGEWLTLVQRGADAGKYVTASAVFGCALYLWFNMKGDRFKGILQLPSLMMEQSAWWFKQLTPSATFKPDEQVAELLPALTPFEWLRDLKIDAKDRKLDEAGCAEEFRKQLGLDWVGVLEAPLHVQCVAVMCGIHATTSINNTVPKVVRRDLTVSEKFRHDLATIYTFEPRETRDDKLRALLRPHLAPDNMVELKTKKKVSLVERIDGKVKDKHAFTSTAAMALLTWARRESGVLSSAEFMWLKVIDRPLHYVLNNVGRAAHHVEGAGAVAHYDAERVLRCSSPEPRVEMAVRGVQVYLDDHNLDPEERFKRETQE